MTPSHPYLELKLSWELFEKGPEALVAPERQQVRELAARQHRLEQRILASREAAAVIVPPATLAERLGEIHQRYPSRDERLQDLEKCGLDEPGLEAAVERDLRVEAVVEKVSAGIPPVTAVEAEIYYGRHPQAFERPEARQLRHILVTFEGAGERAAVLARLGALRPALATPGQFAEAALRHSQCPTAMQGGELGVVRRGQLYAELEPPAFALGENEVSDVLESPMGLHLIRCDCILPSGPIPFPEVRERIVERLTERRRQAALKDWLKAT